MKMTNVRFYDVFDDGMWFKFIFKTAHICGKRIYSLINKEDTPSMFIYYNHKLNNYYFKDFSSGVHGNAISFISLLWDKSVDEVKNILSEMVISFYTGYPIKHILEKYNIHRPHLTDNPDEDIKVEDNSFYISLFQHKEVKCTGYTNESIGKKTYKGINREISYIIDKPDNHILEYFDKYGISEKDVYKHNIYCLRDLCIEKDGISYNIEAKSIIGYFNNEGILLQIYIPKEFSYNGKKQFYTITPSILPVIGSKIITHKKTIIASSIKDSICIYNILTYGGIKSEYNVLSLYNETPKIREEWLSIFKKLSKPIYLIYDNDEVGRKNMLSFIDNHNKENAMIEPLKTDIIPVYFDDVDIFMKDVSDSIATLGFINTSEIILNKLKLCKTKA